MKKLITIFFTAAILLNAQTETQNQSIELPDFVITGIQNISVPEMSKKKPGLVQTLSQEFFKPKLIPDQFKLSKQSNPLRKEYNVLNTNNYNNGLLIIGAGLQTLPEGEFYFNTGYQHFLFNSHIWGSNIKNYSENSGYNISGIEAGTDFFLSTKSDFLPGLKISLDGVFKRESYKFFASSNPERKRENEYITGSFSLTNNLSEYLKYGISGNLNTLKFKDSNFQENTLNSRAYLEFALGKLGFALTGFYQIQDLKKSFISHDKYNYFGGEASFIIKSFKSLNVKFGVHYSKMDSTKLFSPIASFDLKLDDNVSLLAKYSPYSNLMTTSKFLNLNRYYLPLSFDNVLLVRNSLAEFSFKYEHYRYFDITFGTAFSSNDNQYYFDDTSNKGIFTVNKEDNVRYLNAFIEFYFHRGKFGYFYGEFNFNYLKNDNGQYLPYNPIFNTKLTYGFFISDNFEISTEYIYFGKSYADILNNRKLPAFIDLSFGLKYEFIKNLKITLNFNNVLNNGNFFYEGYKEKIFDTIAGIEYRW